MAQLSHLIHTYGVLDRVRHRAARTDRPADSRLPGADHRGGAGGRQGRQLAACSWRPASCACLISDYFWFRAGRFYGKRILRLLCKISLSPDSCVSQTEDNFGRWGAKSLVVAKFIPGFNTIAPPLAGAMGTTTQRFIWLSMAGGLLWSGVGMGLGAWFHGSVDDVIAWFETLGSTALMVVGALLAPVRAAQVYGAPPQPRRRRPAAHHRRRAQGPARGRPRPADRRRPRRHRAPAGAGHPRRADLWRRRRRSA
jgi:hypothetical protein